MRSTILKKKNIYFLLISGVLTSLMLGFQNCAKTKLDRMELPVLAHHSGEAKLCLNASATSLKIPALSTGTGALNIDFSQYTLARYFVTHLNLSNYQNTFKKDSDSDGIADEFEEQHGMNPLLRRSVGPMLDGICSFNLSYQNCDTFIPDCDTTRGPMGLSQCDLMAAGIPQPSLVSSAGLDSDTDGIPDVIETYKHTWVNQNDLLLDPDGDGVLNSIELNQGSHMGYFDVDKLDPNYIYKTSAEKSVSDPQCAGGESWKVSFQNLAVIEIPAFIDPQDTDADTDATHLQLSHQEDENVGLLTIELKPRADASGLKNKLLYHSFKFRETTPPLSVDLSNFIWVGELSSEE